MKDLGGRQKFFAPSYGSMVEAGGWEDAPEGWMKSDTHYRPWFNVYHDVKYVGFGAAVGGDGKLRAFGVAVGTKPHTAEEQSDSYTFQLPLKSGEQMEREKKYPSIDGRQYLIWNKDGNLQIFYFRDPQPNGDKDEWVWGLANSPHKISPYEIKSVRISASGQLEVLGENDKVLWTAPNTKLSLGGTDVSQDPVVLGQGGAQSARQATPPPAATATPPPVTTPKPPPATAPKQNADGFFYNAYAAKSAADVCPAGWRVPTQADFQALVGQLNPDAHLKLSDPKFWGNGNKMTNASGFGARPAGGFAGDAPDGNYDAGKSTYFWSSTATPQGQTYILSISSGVAGIGSAGNRYGFCVRCISEQPGDGTSTPSITDADGNSYKTVRVGQQLWMAEDLRTTKFSDGTPIPFVSDKGQWVKLNSAAYTSVSQTPPVSAPAAADPFKMPLPPGTTLQQGKRYVSSDGKHYLAFQNDNNLVIKRVADDGFVWGLNAQPNVDYKKANAARVTDQRRFTVVDSANREIWGFDMNGPSGAVGTHLDITSDGHLTARNP